MEATCAATWRVNLTDCDLVCIALVSVKNKQWTNIPNEMAAGYHTSRSLYRMAHATAHRTHRTNSSDWDLHSKTQYTPRRVVQRSWRSYIHAAWPYIWLVAPYRLGTTRGEGNGTLSRGDEHTIHTSSSTDRTLDCFLAIYSTARTCATWKIRQEWHQDVNTMRSIFHSYRCSYTTVLELGEAANSTCSYGNQYFLNH